MAYPSVTNTLANGTANDATAVNTNFTDIINGLSDGTKNLNMNDADLAGTLDVTGNVTMGGTVGMTGAVTADYLTPHKGAPTVSMVWKDAATITLKAGRYWIGDKLVTLAADSDWSWTMDGVEAEAVSTWYYLYAYNLAGVVTPFASATAPTGLYDTNMVTAAYDTNVYLGAFYNDSGGDIQRFVQNGARFIWTKQQTAVSHTGDLLMTSKTIRVPASANIALGWVECNATATAVYISSDGTNAIKGMQSYLQVPMFVEAPLITAQTIYISTGDITKVVYFYASGWVDKWI